MANEQTPRQQNAEASPQTSQMGSPSNTGTASAGGAAPQAGRGQGQTPSWQAQGTDPRQSPFGGVSSGQREAHEGTARSGTQGYGGRDQGYGGRDQAPGRAGALQRGGGLPSLFGGASPSYGPFSAMQRISEEMDRLFDAFGLGRSALGDFAESSRGSSVARSGENTRSLWAPHIEVCESNGKLVVQADLPGVRREDVNVQIEDDSIVIQGQRKQESTRNERGFYHSERSYGSFYRVIPLPEGVNAETATATFRDGVLQIEIDTPQQRSRARKLEIRDGGRPSLEATAGSGSSAVQGSSAGSGATQGSGAAIGQAGSGAASGLQSGGRGSSHTGETGSDTPGSSTGR